MAASYNGKMKYVSELVKSGADCTLRCQKGYTAVDWASKKNNTPIIEFLQYYLYVSLWSYIFLETYMFIINHSLNCILEFVTMRKSFRIVNSLN